MGKKSAADGRGVTAGVAADTAGGGNSESCAPNRGLRRTLTADLLAPGAHLGIGWKIGDRKRWYELPEEVGP